MDEEKDQDNFKTYTGRSTLQRPLYLIYILLAVSYLLVVIGFAVTLSKATTLSSQLSETRNKIKNNPSGRDLNLFPCGPDNVQWEYFNGKCYFFSLQAVPWQQAKTKCEEQHARLVVIDGFPKQNFIQTRTRNFRFWIGLHDLHTEGEWKWVDGSDYNTGFKYWKQGEPNSYRSQDEDCGQVWINGEWDDYTCNSNSLFICERPMPSTPPTSKGK
ncbi:hepatic lectin-like [Eublepharis macularius]|uniref:Hepatic lectin-like n=1 Tax=Eublepharis macularius TaxID=481883 RepID=A0AA97LM53_EUBMA|nr:hepatic lectin-like [Eublepharis macularius]